MIDITNLIVGETIYTILRHCSRSGMMRVVEAYVIRNNRPVCIGAILTDDETKKLPFKRDRTRDGYVIGGCGMDVGFELVYTIGAIAFPNGFDCMGDKCLSNDHMNGDHRSHHSDGGYAFKHNWL